MKLEKYTYPFPEKDFPFTIASIVSKKNDPRCINTGNVPHCFHLHPFAVEIQYIRSGTGFYFIRNKRYPFENRALFIIHGYDTHTYIRSSPIDKSTINISNDLFNNYPTIKPLVKNIMRCRAAFPHKISFNEREAALVELIIELLQNEWDTKGEYYKEAIVHLLAQFFMKSRLTL